MFMNNVNIMEKQTPLLIF